MAKRRGSQNDNPTTSKISQPKRFKSQNYKPAQSSSENADAGLTTGDRKTDSNGDPYWNISRQRRVTVSSFNKKTMVNIREYYEKDGAELPGKKVYIY